MLPAPSPASLRPRWVVALGVVTIIVAGFFVLWPALHGDWLWDDPAEITQNADIQDGASLAKVWSAPTTPDYFPLKATLQWVQWRLWRENRWGYHVSNLLFHLGSCLLLWRVLTKLGVKSAWLGGLLFAIHPLTVESVAWIAEFKNTVSLFWLLFAFSAYLDFDRTRRWPKYCLALAFFLAAMLSKTSVVMFPPVLCVYLWWNQGRWTLKDLGLTAPFFLISLGLGLVTIAFQSHRAINGWDFPTSTALSRFACAGLAILFYAYKSVWPTTLLPIYPQWSVNPPSALQLSAWIVIAGALFFFWLKRKTWGRHALFGTGWFILILLPVLGFASMSFMHISWVADHFVYVPLLGLIALAVAAYSSAVGRFTPPYQKIAHGAAALLCLGLALQGRAHAAIFRDQMALWTYTVQHNPSAWLAQSNLGAEFIRAKNWSAAISPLQASVRAKPNQAEARVNLGNAFIELKRTDEAIVQLREAVRLDPELPSAHYNLANAYARGGRLLTAVDEYEAALKLNPNAPDVHYNLGNTLAQMNQLSEAAQHFATAARLNPRFFEAQINLGNVAIALGQMRDAIAAYQRATEIAPDSVEAQYGLADALGQSNQLREALPHFEAALRLSPEQAEIHTSYANVLLQLNQTAAAIQHYQQALRLNPADTEARDSLRIAQMRQR